MPAYLITDLSILDPIGMAEYQKIVQPIISAFDGKFLAASEQVIALEGNWIPERIVITEFPSVERIKEWWNSEMYAKAKELRQKAAMTRMIIVEGIMTK